MVDVFNAIKLAEQVSGVAPPAQPTSGMPAAPPVTNDGSQWNSL
jgi:hypothetical protein